MRASRLVAAAAAVFLMAWAATGGGGGEPRQRYSAWRELPGSKGEQYVANYYYKPSPTDTSYRMQYITWKKSTPNEIYYYNAENEYWCAAPTDKALEGKWHVFTNAERAKTIAALKLKIKLSDDKPSIPGAVDKGVKASEMESPPTKGLPLKP